MLQPPRQRLFLDAGVIIEGCVRKWGSAKGVLVLTALLNRYTVVLAEAIEREVRRTIIRTHHAPVPGELDERLLSYLGWMRRIHLERRAPPRAETVLGYRPTILPVLRHVNDLEPVVSAIESRPDWVISSNDAHWSPALAARTGLRIVTPMAFLDRISEWAARYEQSTRPDPEP